MNLPEGFEELSENESEKILSKGKKSIDKIYDANINISDIKPKLFKIDENNYFLINIREYDPKIDGDYDDAVNQSNGLLYRTYLKSFANTQIDTLNQQKIIDNTEFTKYLISVKASPNTEMKVLNYTSFVKNNDVRIAVVYIDDNIGNKVIQEIGNAKFEK